MSDLLSLCTKYLAVSRFLRDESPGSLQDRLALSEFNERFLDSNFRIAMKKLRKNLSQRKIDSEYFEILSRLEYETTAFYLYRSAMQKVPPHLLKRTEFDFLKMFQALEYNKMDMEVNRAAFNLDFKEDLVSKLFEVIDEDKLLEALKDSDTPFGKEAEIRLRLLKLCNGREDNGNFEKVKKMILEGIDDYSNSERSNLFIKLKNYCAFRIYAGDMRFSKVKYDLLKAELEAVKYNSDGVGPLYANIFLELVQKALSEKETDYAEETIRRFSDFLESGSREQTLRAATALLEFEKANYAAALELCSRTVPFNLQTKILMRTLAVKACYELGFQDQCRSALDSLRRFIKESKEINRSRRTNLRSKLASMQKLYRLRFEPDKAGQIPDNDPDEWVRKKLKEISVTGNTLQSLI